MKPALFVAVALTLLGCENQPFAPTDINLAPVAVSVAPPRAVNANEKIPDFIVTSSRSMVSVRVSTHGQCEMNANVRVDVQRGEINIVARTYSGALADCVDLSSLASDYSFNVLVAFGGRYRVNVFQARAGDDLQFVGSRNVNVAGASQGGF